MLKRHGQRLAALGALLCAAFVAAIVFGVISVRAGEMEAAIHAPLKSESAVEKKRCDLRIEDLIAAAKGRASLISDLPSPVHALLVQRLQEAGEKAGPLDSSYGFVFGDEARIVFAYRGCVIGSAVSTPIAIMTVIDLTLHGVIAR